jgi:hypothetical protein
MESDLEAPTQDNIEIERMMSGRCPRCGSDKCWPTDYVWDGEDEHPVGNMCGECPYDSDVDHRNPTPFIMPGQPGAKDSPDQYPDIRWGEECTT